MSAKRLTLLDLPITVANHVLEKLEIEELLTCRKVCRTLRTAVDKLGAHFTNLRVWLQSNRVSIDLDRITITYSSSSLGGTYVKCDYRRRKKKYIRDDNYLKIAFNDLKIFQKHASCLMIQTILEGKDREYVVHSLVDVLKEEENIHMKTIRLHHDLSIDDMLLILPLFNSQTLRSIELGGMFSDHEFKRITHLDQWKKAKHFNFWDSWFKFQPIEHFLHFEEFTFDTQDFPIQNVIKIRDDLLQRCTFQKCTITFLKINFTPLEFARIFQPDYAGGDDFTLEYSNGKSRFDISFGDSEFCDMWMFKMKRC
ncbi:F-box domain-containing protein [Caenorhabditis elegans]|uniref:F-box domain-containing protein n=1 Tax=Caenorhabditis elegans TaxID=6239 RepID=Q966E4_CAEEL|nr:F-box domain-containing protein [Caenorhabditis elegans]CCD73911.1 F-box domain-containing protein [Caenorhabditis elegans]|eukprot:NP_497375.1 F-box A protein [Caenorhabditis elegans]